VNLTRLMALGILARSGASHGHHIRRIAEITNVGEWGGVSVGALYRELRTMEREGLVEALRTEKVGNRPERTVYEITAEGQLELTTLREQAIKPLMSGHDPLGVALTFAADGMDREELRRMLRARREMLAIGIAEVAADRARLVSKGLIDMLAAANMQRGIMGIEAEIRWHDELDAALAKAGGANPAGPDDGPARSLSGGSLKVAQRRAALGIAAEGAGGPPAAGAATGRGSAGGAATGRSLGRLDDGMADNNRDST
jgi:DNA-binding PadR family transcriptional regulator